MERLNKRNVSYKELLIISPLLFEALILDCSRGNFRPSTWRHMVDFNAVTSWAE